MKKRGNVMPSDFDFINYVSAMSSPYSAHIQKVGFTRNVTESIKEICAMHSKVLSS